jgi:pilus assembly protein Flp/PilA
LTYVNVIGLQFLTLFYITHFRAFILTINQQSISIFYFIVVELRKPAAPIRSNLEQTMKSIFARFLKDQSGATAIEYGLIAALISVVAITTLTAVGSKLNVKFTSISGGLN